MGCWRRGSGFHGFGFQVSRFQVSGFGLRVSGFEFRVSGFGFQVSGCEGWRVLRFRFRVSLFGLKVSDFGFWVSGFGFQVSKSGVLVASLAVHILDFMFQVSDCRSRVFGFGLRGYPALAARPNQPSSFQADP